MHMQNLFILFITYKLVESYGHDVGANIPPLIIAENLYSYTTTQISTLQDNGPVSSQLFSNCSIRQEAYMNKIVGGEIASPGEFPWQVSIQIYPDWKPFHICGGAILTEEWVITAGHCLEEMDAQYLGVVVGEYNLFRTEGHEQRRKISIVVNSNFDSDTFARDIALLRVDSPFKLNSWVTPICLPEAGETFSGEGTIAGWGRLSEDGQTSDVLNKVTLPLVDIRECKQSYQQLHYDKFFSGCQICAGNSEGGQDACQGDSGGPLMCTKGEDNLYYLCGIVSWGIGCARPNFLGIYTDIACYTNWIYEVIYNRNNLLGL